MQYSRIFLLAAYLLFLRMPVIAQNSWQQQVNHHIEAVLDPEEKSIHAQQVIHYFNNSRDTLRFIYLHIWPNAYKNDHTAYSEQLLRNNRLDFYFSKETERGYINRLQFSANNEVLEWQEDSIHQDYGKLLLKEPLLPNRSIEILNSFHIRLPKLFSRSGYKENFFAVTQWFPKPAVYDEKGWHPLPYLDKDEFHNEVGDYEVIISVPQEYKISATGKRLPVSSSVFLKKGYRAEQFSIKNATDFAWFASPDFIISGDSVQLASHKTIWPEAAVQKKNEARWEGSLSQLKRRFLSPSNMSGDYPGNYGIDSSIRRKVRPVFVFSNRSSDKYYYLGIGPAIGYNHYDGLQAGLFIHNYQLPLSRFRFFVSPLYGTNSRNWGGAAHMSYHWLDNKLDSDTTRKNEWILGVNFFRFTMNDFNVGSTNLKFDVIKLAPYLKFSIGNRSPLSQQEQFIQLSSYIFREQMLDSRLIIDGTDTSILDQTIPQNRTLQQLRFYHANNRILYPYDVETRAEISNSFSRLTVTAHYFLNYARPDGTGIMIRFFGGKFIHLGSLTLDKELQNYRYHLNLTGANGWEDYTYSNYFVGRNEFSGWKSQQLMIRDGGFKVRTDLLSSKIGRSDNWLTALNMTADIPSSINPLSKLPVPIPLKLFLDVGTYAEAWEAEDESARFLMDAGLQLSLFRNLLNLYIPVVNSRVFRDYHRSVLGEKKFWKTISFSIDIQNISAKKWLLKQAP